MELVADESIDKSIVNRLRRDGHNVVYVSELEPGLDDNAVLQRANQIGALLLTADKDFGELVFRRDRIHAGVILVRLAGLSAEAKARTVGVVFENRASDLINAFSVISPGTTGIRRRRNET